MLSNTVIPESPMFKPEFPPQGAFSHLYIFVIFFFSSSVAKFGELKHQNLSFI